MMRIHRDGEDQLCITWEQAPGIEKRAWVQYRSGSKDWAKSGRYINVVRCNDKSNPSGNATDFPVHVSQELSDRDVLIAFVLPLVGGICGSLSVVDETSSQGA